MSRKKNPSPFGSIRREIARRLKNQLPLAGIIAATALLCGCNERSGRVPMGSVPREIPPEEQQNEQQITEPPPQPNCKNETATAIIMGDVSEPPPSNRKNETFDPASTMGRYPANPEHK